VFNFLLLLLYLKIFFIIFKIVNINKIYFLKLYLNDLENLSEN
jgi:hypothetical protein